MDCLNPKNNVYVLDFRGINITLHDLYLPRCDKVILFETNIKVTMDSSEWIRQKETLRNPTNR